MNSLATLNKNENRQIDTHSPLSFDQKKVLPIEKINWLSPEEYCEIEDKVRRGSFSQVTKNSLMHLTKRFIGAYPNPKEWLETPPEDRLVILYKKTSTEINYIIHWSINSQVAKGDDPVARERQIALANYYIHRSSQKFVEYSLYYGFLTHEEIEAASHMPSSVGMIQRLAKHTLVLAKPLKEFTVEDLKLYKYMEKISKYKYNLKNLLQLMRQLKIDLNYDELKTPKIPVIFDMVRFKKNRYVQDVTDWLTVEEYSNLIGTSRNFASNHTRRTVQTRNCNTASDFLITYPTPEDWWNIPSNEKQEIRGTTRANETAFIINWVCTTPINYDCDKRERQLQLASYFYQRRGNCFLKWATYYGYITDEEIVKLREFHKNSNRVLNGLSRHVIILQKSIKDFTKEDLWLIPYIKVNHYTEKLVLDALLYLGYGETPGKMCYQSYFDIAKAHPKWGCIANNYHGYLVRGFASEEVFRNRGILVKKLFDYLERNNLPDCSMFDFGTFLKLKEYFSTGTKGEKIGQAYLSRTLYILREFMDWGINKCLARGPFFPEKLDFPNDELERSARIKIEEYAKCDGLAFLDDDPEYPDLLVNAINAYEPQDEIEELCRNFWLVLASCPVRFSTLLNLQANDPMLPMPNAPEVMGLYSEPADKAGNRNGQFPIIDPMGVEAMKALESRVKNLELKPMFNRAKQRTYIHFFGLPKPPWRIPRQTLTEFIYKVKDTIPGGRERKGTAHSFRHYLLTHIAIKTGNMDLVQLAAGHRYFSMTRLYLRSKLSRKSLLWAMFKKYKSNELSGKFYFRLFELLAGDEVPTDEMFKALCLDEHTLEQFLKKYGLPAPTGCGQCMNQKPCSWNADNACFGCSYWILRKSDVQYAIVSLARMVRTMQKMVIGSKNFSYENLKAKSVLTNITALNVYIENLGFSDEWIEDMLMSELSKLVLQECAK